MTTRTFVIQVRTLVPEDQRDPRARPGWEWHDIEVMSSMAYRPTAVCARVRASLVKGSTCDFADLDDAKFALSVIVRPPEWEYRIIRRDVSVTEAEQSGTRIRGTRSAAA